MLIGIDARVMTLSASGIGRYSIEMIKAISQLNQTKNHQQESHIMEDLIAKLK